MATKKKSVTEEVRVIRATRESATFVVKGCTPIILNRMSEKAKRELLLPSGRKTTGDKRTTLKHNPYEEFRASPYTVSWPTAPTLLVVPSTAFKNAMRSVAVDIAEQTSKAQLGRLTYVEKDYVPLYGVPKLKMDVVRCAGMNRTPDVRTRACVPEWVSILTVTFAVPILNGDAIASLLANAGIMQGVGDYRVEKGAGNFGTWELTDLEDPDVVRIMAEGGREAQIASMTNPDFYDDETAELYSWFEEEATRRGMLKPSRAAI